MASIRKRGEKWQATVVSGDFRQSKAFPTKKEATIWANELEADVMKGTHSVCNGKTFRDVLVYYRDMVVPTKRGAKWETDRINMLLGRTYTDRKGNVVETPADPIADVLLSQFKKATVSDWRDRRLLKVQGSSVLREWAILQHAMGRAVEKDWIEYNPFKEVERPKGNAPRKRRPEGDETERLMAAANYTRGTTPVTKIQRAVVAYLLGMATGMRQGEMAGIEWEDITGRVVNLPLTKNGEERDVPLSNEAMALIELFPSAREKTGYLIGLNASQIESNFRRAKKKAKVVGLHFHDTRREAITVMSKKVDVMTLSAISGHKDIRVLRSTYYAPDMQDIASKLN